MISIVQIIIILFALFALSRTLLRFKERKLETRGSVFWCGVWIIIIVISLIPKVAIFLSNIVGLKRGLDVIVVISIVVIFYLIFRILVKIEKIEQEITKIVREIALSNHKRKK